MNPFTIEFLLFSILVFTITRLKNRFKITEKLLDGLRIFMLPSARDITEKKGRVSLPFSAIDTAFSHKQQFFDESDVLVLLTLVSAALMSSSSIVAQYIPVENNLSFLLMIFVLFMCVHGLYTHVARAGIRNPDNILSYVFCLLMLSGLALLLIVDHGVVMDFDIQASHRLLELQTTYAFQHYWDIDFEIPYNMFAIGVTMVYALAMMPIYRYILRYVSNFYSSNQFKKLIVTNNFDNSEYYSRLFITLMASPFPLLILWIKPLSKNFIVPEYLSEDQYNGYRAALVLLLSILRLHLMKFEVQNLLNNAGSIVYSMISDKKPTEENLRTSLRQIQAITNNAWSTAHQSLWNIIVPIFIAFLLFQRGFVPPAATTTVQTKQVSKLTEIDNDEFILQDSQQEIVHKATEKIEFVDALELQQKILDLKNNRINLGDEEPSFMSKIGTGFNVGFVPAVLYRDLANLALWWHCSVWALASLYAVAYVYSFKQWKADLPNQLNQRASINN